MDFGLRIENFPDVVPLCAVMAEQFEAEREKRIHRGGNFCSGWVGAQLEQAKPHILLAITDDWGLGHAVCWYFDGVGNAIRKLRYEGVCGTYTFDRPEQAPLVHPWQTEDVKAGVSHLLLQVQDGKHKIIAPAELAEVKIKPAPWF